ncbi:MAG: TonB-dependent receptor [Halieaceae bacterium]|jgi:TonB-dependent receptor|nr:TonB-dependent receptor [Halieaceae bacterium]
MKHAPSARNDLAVAVAVALGLAPAALLAQQEPDQEPDRAPKDAVLEEVVVTGVRASIQRAMDQKRDAAGVMDAISAQDLGVFPDTNLAESLQRITGVSISRERGEGQEVTVRGFGPEFNLVTLNGRQMPTQSGINRSFDFANIAAEGVSGVQVYKTGKADMPTGGIGSTINISTTRPLERPGLHSTLALRAVHDTSTEEGNEITPEISGIVSNTFADDTFGVALSFSSQERDSGVQTARVDGWRSFPGTVDQDWGAGTAEWGGVPDNDPNQVNRPGPDDVYSVPQVIGYELAEFNRKRLNGQLTLQWRPVDSVTATVDYTYANHEFTRTYSNMSGWFNFAGQQTVWSDGPIATPLTYTEIGAANDLAMGAGLDGEEETNESVGLNLIWDVTERLSLEFDYHDSSAELAPNSRFGNTSTLGLASYTRTSTTGYFGNDLPILDVALSGPLDPNDMIVAGSVFTQEVARMEIQQAKFAGRFDFNEMSHIDFGVQITEVDNRSALSTVQRDTWGGVTQPGDIADLMTPASMAGAFDAISGSGDERRDADYFTFNLAEVVARTEELQASGAVPVAPIADLGDCGTGLCPSSNYSVDRRTNEEAIAAYVHYHLSMDLFDRPANFHAGVRYEETDVSSEALVPTYSGVDWVGGNEFVALAAVDENGNQIRDFTSLGGSYDNVLPNIDFDIEIIRDLVGRISWSRTMTRPNYQDIQGGFTIDTLLRVDGGTGRQGNPELLPFESDNLDLSLEWYYGDSSYVSAGYFRKDVENFIAETVNENVPVPFDLPHPAFGSLYDRAAAATGSSDSGVNYAYILANFPDEPGVNAANGVISGVAGRDGNATFDVTVPTNFETAKIDGWEIAWQHALGETGFGWIVNATFADGDTRHDDFNLTQQFVLPGLSDSANFIAYYDKNGIQVRVAYNWRDAYLSGLGQPNVGVGPTYVDEYGQWDASAFYQWDHWQLFFEAVNFTNETIKVFGRADDQVLQAVQTGERYNFGVRWKY